MYPGAGSVLIGNDWTLPYVPRCFGKEAPPRIRYIVNTHFHQDLIDGNEAIAKADQSAAGMNNLLNLGPAGTIGAAVIAHDNVLKRLSAPTGSPAPVPFALWPTETYTTKKIDIFNGEAVQIIHEPAAHTDDIVSFSSASRTSSARVTFSTPSVILRLIGKTAEASRD